MGNRLTSLGVSPYTYNSGNWLTSIPGTTYNYDNNGSLTSKSDGTAYSWDFENHLSQVTLPSAGGTVNFKYDPLGRRIQKTFTQGSTTTTTNYVYDGPNAIEEVDANGAVVARYTQGLGIDEPLAELRSGTTSYYQADGLGSITSLSNTAGALANTYTYDSFGKLTASSGTIVNPFQFTGRDFDSETGLRYYRTRYYDQNIGRFTSEDRSRFKGGINLYTYVGNDATNLTDPNGTAFKTCAKALADLLAAQFLASERLAAYLRHADWDPHHANSLGQALTNLQRALDQVKKFCKCDPTAPAIIALATALVAEIVDALRQVCSEEPEICYAWI